jgi:hypothetical protein
VVFAFSVVKYFIGFFGFLVFWLRNKASKGPSKPKAQGNPGEHAKQDIRQRDFFAFAFHQARPSVA